MGYRKLGRTGVDVGVVGLGAEYIWHEPYATVASVVNEALDNGINYIDLFMGSPDVRDHFGKVLKGRRDRLMLAGHLGCADQEGQYWKTRDQNVCKTFIEDFYRRVQTDYIDVLFLHNVDDLSDFDEMFGPGGILQMALALKSEGRARFLGFSSHKVSTALKAVESGVIDVLMFPVNPVTDALPGETGVEIFWEENAYQPAQNSQSTGRDELYRACARCGVGIVAMKPYAAGWLFNPENPSGISLTPIQCLSYALAQPGISTVVPGCKNVHEVRDALSYLDASDSEKDFSVVKDSEVWRLNGRCMYCNHCLPCPVGIDVASVTRLADAAKNGLTDLLRAEYEVLSVKASACLDCGACAKRCPFGVDSTGNIKRAAKIFEI